MGKYDGKRLVYYVDGVKISSDKNARSVYLNNFEAEWRATLGNESINSAVSVVRDGDKVTVVTNEVQTLALCIE